MRFSRSIEKPAYLFLLIAVVLAGCGSGEDAGAPPQESGAEEPTPLHPSFSLERDSLLRLIDELPPTTQERIVDNPYAFLDLSAQLLQAPPELLRLVDKEHPLPEDYAPEDLVDLEIYADTLRLNREELSLRRILMDDLLAMVAAAREEGIELPISSTYRSYDYQAWLFDYWVEELGLEEAERSSARPGTSQHQLGTTVDFGSITNAFAETEAGRWLAENAHRFGFSLSYPDGYEELTGYKYESWHFRYIGRPAAEMERTFFGGIQQRMLLFWKDARAHLEAAYETE